MLEYILLFINRVKIRNSVYKEVRGNEGRYPS